MNLKIEIIKKLKWIENSEMKIQITEKKIKTERETTTDFAKSCMNKVAPVTVAVVVILLLWNYSFELSCVRILYELIKFTIEFVYDEI